MSASDITPFRKTVNLISNVTYFQLHNCTMDTSFEVLAFDGSFHEQQAVRPVYQCNVCPYKSSYKQNLNRHKHTKHPMPLGTMSRQAVCFCVFLCVFLIGLVNGKSQAAQCHFMFIGLSKTGLVSIR